MTTVDLTGVGETTAQVESITWVAIGGGVNERRYVIQDGASSELYREYEQYTSYDWGDRRTQRRVDPLGANLTTTWTWANSAGGLVLESVQNPNGSWAWYNIALDGGGDEIIQEIAGWKDQTFLTDPSPMHAGVRSTTRTYASSEDFRLLSDVRYLGGNLVAHTDYTNTYDSGVLLSTAGAQWQDTGGLSTSTTTTYYWNGDQDRVDHILHPDARWDQYTYDDTVAFTPSGSLPGTPPSYDMDGSGYYYRLIKVEPGGTPQSGQYKAEYSYDWQGRRIEKQVWSYSNGWTQTEDWKFMYADRLLLLELNALDSDSVKRQYTWGLDLSGVAAGAPAGRLTGGGLPTALTGAGGIGGLLSVHDSAGPVNYVYFADVQGNIGQVVDLAAASASASMMARYDYDAYGNRTAAAGAYTQPSALSTRLYDSETGLQQFQYRFYSPVLGAWMSRDPSQELGGYNLYLYAGSDPVNNTDPLGP